ncbi:hypothetical protein L3Q67_38805 [Saccharothrix sp. AJ9571]|nr:hypothetical protein L3Q67_38805 [Saccharothrix sp. AJ9571]
MGNTGHEVNPAALKQGSGAAAEVREQLGKDGRIPDETTQTAARTLGAENFQLGTALKHTGELWYSQITTLHQACHKIEQSLAAGAGGYQLNEDKTELSMAEIAEFFE